MTSEFSKMKYVLNSHVFIISTVFMVLISRAIDHVFYSFWKPVGGVRQAGIEIENTVANS